MGADPSNKERETEQIVIIGTLHRVIHKARLSLLESKAVKYDLIMKQLRTNKHNGTQLRDALIGCVSSIVP